MWGFCKKCDTFDNLNAHICPPIWHVSISNLDYENDKIADVYAYSAEGAAEKAAFKLEMTEEINNIIIMVKNSKEGPKEFKVHENFDPVFSKLKKELINRAEVA